MVFFFDDKRKKHTLIQCSPHLNVVGKACELSPSFQVDHDFSVGRKEAVKSIPSVLLEQLYDLNKRCDNVTYFSNVHP